ncbi:MAG: HPr kinase/phosphorylase [Hyphomicrobiaceae bacterium]
MARATGDGCDLIHATAIATAETGSCVLITGPSGAGKSDLALRLLSWPASGLDVQPFRLVADDQVCIEPDGSRLIARPPDTLAGKLEVRGIGIVDLPYLPTADVHLVVELVPPEKVERMPDPMTTMLAGLLRPVIRLFAFEPSAPLKVALALQGRNASSTQDV